MPAPLTLDYANCLHDRIGRRHGVDPKDLAGAGAALAGLTRRLAGSRGTGWERWRDLAAGPMRDEHLSAVRPLVERLRPECRNLVVLGIGGSALGNIALQAALNPPTWNLAPHDDRLGPDGRPGPRLFVMDNVDPGTVATTLAEVRRDDPGFEHTIVNVISKSGETAETAAQFMIARAMLTEVLGPRHAERIVATTDPARGTMRAICDDAGYATLPVPEGVGGRFSVLSPVGLFSAAMCGIDVDALLDGAAAMDERCTNGDATENPAATLAWLLFILAARGKPNHVMMPYADGLSRLADWFAQLWAESLGKRLDTGGNQVFAGATPIKALGATDQHSQIQLYREGPNDKVIGFLEVERFAQDVTIPAGLGVENLAYLEDATLGTLLNAEKRATEYALCESERPNFTIRFPEITAHTVGQFVMLWQITTAYAGLLMNVDAYDQPAVETGKVATFGLMGRPGFDEWRAKVDARLGATEHRIG